jgi:hypothetical protein
VVSFTVPLYAPLDDGSGATTFVDVSGNNYHAARSVESRSCPTAGQRGFDNTALAFDGTKDYAEVDYEDALNPSGDFTVAPQPAGCTTGFDVNLTLPASAPDGNDKLCRYTGSGWTCAASSFATSVFPSAASAGRAPEDGGWEL